MKIPEVRKKNGGLLGGFALKVARERGSSRGRCVEGKVLMGKGTIRKSNS